MSEPVPLVEYVRGAAALLADAGVPSPEVDARALAAHALGRERLTPFDLRSAAPPPASFAPAYAELVARRGQRVPLQHLVGRTTFRYLDVAVRPGVFVPRPETEVVAQVAIDAVRARRAAAAPGPDAAAAPAPPLVVDLCCGAGVIALSVAWETGARVVAVDASGEAVALARENLAAHLPRTDGGPVAPAPRVEQGDVRDAALLAALDGLVDVVVSNPPYIPPHAVPQELEVREHDPDLALYGGGADGLDVPRAVVHRAARLLRPGGVLVMEHAEVQAEQVRDLVARAGLTGIETFRDLTGRPRGVRGVRAEVGPEAGRGRIGR